jgi:hypothetical protein
MQTLNAQIPEGLIKIVSDPKDQDFADTSDYSRLVSQAVLTFAEGDYDAGIKILKTIAAPPHVFKYSEYLAERSILALIARGSTADAMQLMQQSQEITTGGAEIVGGMGGYIGPNAETELAGRLLQTKSVDFANSQMSAICSKTGAICILYDYFRDPTIGMRNTPVTCAELLAHLQSSDIHARRMSFERAAQHDKRLNDDPYNAFEFEVDSELLGRAYLDWCFEDKPELLKSSRLTENFGDPAAVIEEQKGVICGSGRKLVLLTPAFGCRCHSGDRLCAIEPYISSPEKTPGEDNKKPPINIQHAKKIWKVFKELDEVEKFPQYLARFLPLSDTRNSQPLEEAISFYDEVGDKPESARLFEIYHQVGFWTDAERARTLQQLQQGKTEEAIAFLSKLGDFAGSQWVMRQDIPEDIRKKVYEALWRYYEKVSEKPQVPLGETNFILQTISAKKPVKYVPVLEYISNLKKRFPEVFAEKSLLHFERAEGAK